MTAGAASDPGVVAGAAPSDDRRRLVSIIVPAYNEEANLPALREELLAVVDTLPYDFELLVIDNSSVDRTREIVLGWCAEDPRWKYIRFSRNFNLEASITAGYRAASGDAMIVLYSDLQDPPDAIPKLLERWEEGYDVVYGVRTVRPGDPRWRNGAIRLAYRVISALSEVDIPANAGDFRLITARVRDALEQCGEYNRYTRGLIAWLGFRQVGVTYERRPREAGRSSFGLFDLITFAFTAITSFSVKPLRLLTVFGFVLVGLSLAAIPVYAALYLAGNPPPGVTTLVVLVLFGIGVQSSGLGLLGEYVGRTYAEVRRRPLFVIEETANLGAGQRGAPGSPRAARAD